MTEQEPPHARTWQEIRERCTRVFEADGHEEFLCEFPWCTKDETKPCIDHLDPPKAEGLAAPAVRSAAQSPHPTDDRERTA